MTERRLQFGLASLFGVIAAVAMALGILVGLPSLDAMTAFLLGYLFLVSCPAVGAFIWLTIVDECPPKSP